MRQMRRNLGGTLLALICSATVLGVACSEDQSPPLDADGSGGTTFSVASNDGGSGGSGNRGSTGSGGSGGTSSGSLSTTSGATNGSGGEGGACEGPDCGPRGPGEGCTEAIEVDTTGFVRAGDDFTQDFGDNFTLGDDESCAFSATGSSDAVFKVTLDKGQELSVTQKGGLDATLSIQSSCGPKEACLATTRDNSVPLRHVASEDETVYVVVEAIEVEPESGAYELHIDIDPECGNGVLEGPEECDDDNTDAGDGCSVDCTVEFPYACDKASPSVCKPYPSLGSADADGTIEPFEYEDTFLPSDHLFRTVTFTEAVLADLTLSTRTPGTGDINAFVWSDWGVSAALVTNTGASTQQVNDVYFEVGTYLIEFFARTDLPEGFLFTIDVKAAPICGDGVFFPASEECDAGGDPGCDSDCKVEFGWECTLDSPSVCTEIDSLGAYQAGETIDPVVWLDPMPFSSSDYWMIEFADDVLLDAVAIGNEDLDVDGNYIEALRILNEDGDLLLDVPPTNGTTGAIEIDDATLPAGLYRIEIQTDTGLPEGYTLTLSTTAP